MWGFVKFWTKIALIGFGVLVILFVIFLLISPSTPNEEVSGEKSERTAEQQLVDVRNKINELPELEKDIFAKCITDKNKTAENIRACQERTQKEIFTLSQDLKNLERSLLEQIEN
jgi:hypothetical protein